MRYLRSRCKINCKDIKLCARMNKERGARNEIGRSISVVHVEAKLMVAGSNLCLAVDVLEPKLDGRGFEADTSFATKSRLDLPKINGKHTHLQTQLPRVRISTYCRFYWIQPMVLH